MTQHVEAIIRKMSQSTKYHRGLKNALRPEVRQYKQALWELRLQESRIQATQAALKDIDADIEYYSKVIQELRELRPKVKRRLYSQQYQLRKLQQAQNVDDVDFMIDNMTALRLGGLAAWRLGNPY